MTVPVVGVVHVAGTVTYDHDLAVGSPHAHIPDEFDAVDVGDRVDAVLPCEGGLLGQAGDDVADLGGGLGAGLGHRGRGLEGLAGAVAAGLDSLFRWARLAVLLPFHQEGGKKGGASIDRWMGSKQQAAFCVCVCCAVRV